MVRTTLITLALAGLAATSPAPIPQMLDLDQIAAAPAAATGPAGITLDENISITNDVTVTTVAAPAGTGLQKRTSGWGYDYNVMKYGSHHDHRFEDFIDSTKSEYHSYYCDYYHYFNYDDDDDDDDDDVF
ncbi:hypothetical protein CAC42_6843 [Sphaceloma murrayae]|uniref:Uncharacterized protein n=1 Tax=Sphaceloma murrayae TaxID=2082308 RepID=A0A2K1QHE9_9PEZI|nr:hypothetical protein CAC42_6843 [Sphaceloma murrayae]